MRWMLPRKESPRQVIGEDSFYVIRSRYDILFSVGEVFLAVVLTFQYLVKIGRHETEEKVEVGFRPSIAEDRFVDVDVVFDQ